MGTWNVGRLSHAALPAAVISIRSYFVLLALLHSPQQRGREAELGHAAHKQLVLLWQPWAELRHGLSIIWKYGCMDGQENKYSMGTHTVAVAPYLGEAEADAIAEAPPAAVSDGDGGVLHSADSGNSVGEVRCPSGRAKHMHSHLKRPSRPILSL